MGFPIITRRILERVPQAVLKTPFARAIVRKAGVRLPAEEEGAFGSLPVPILSLEGSKPGCSAPLQTLINRWRSQAEGTPERAAALADLIAYIEDAIGQTLEEAYPTEWEAALNGEPQVIEIDLGTDVVTLTLGLCVLDEPEEGNECQLELFGLVEAVNTSPTAQNIAALFAFIQNHTGMSVEEHVGASWAELIENAEVLTTTIFIPECEVAIILVLGGTLNTELTCANLPVHPPITFGVNDFDLSEVITETSNQGTISTSTYTEQEFPMGHSNIQLHLDDPEFVYLEEASDGTGAGQVQLNRNRRIDYASPATGGVFAGGFPVGYTYFPYYRIKGQWTVAIEEVVTDEVFVNVPQPTRYSFHVKFPLVGFTPVHRYPVSSPDPLLPLTSDPLNLGIHEGESADAEHRPGTIPGVDDKTVDIADYGGNIAGFQGEGNTGGLSGLSRSYWLPANAIGDPNVLSGPSPDWTTSSPLQFPYKQTNSLTSRDDALQELLDWISDYQAFQGAYDPQLTFDEDNMEITFTFETDENACYLPLLSCSDYILDVDDLTDPPYDNPPNILWTLLWGGYWHDVGFQAVLVGPTGWPDGRAGAFVRSNVGPVTPASGYWFQTVGFLNALARRLLTGYPEDNVDYAMTSFVEKPLPVVVGEFRPIIDGSTIEFPCPSDARCITPGAP